MEYVAHYWVKETTRSCCSLLGQGDNQIVLLTTGSRRQPDRVAHYWVKETTRSCCSLLGQGDNQIVLLTTGSRRQPDRVADHWVKETTRSCCSLLGQGDNQIVLLTTGLRRQPDRVAHYWVKETTRSCCSLLGQGDNQIVLLTTGRTDAATALPVAVTASTSALDADVTELPSMSTALVPGMHSPVLCDASATVRPDNVARPVHPYSPPYDDADNIR